MSKKTNLPLTKNTLIIIILISFLVSAVVGFLAGSVAFELSRHVSQNNFLQNILPDNENDPSSMSQGGSSLSGNSSQEELIVGVVEKVAPAVVSIIITKDLPIIERYYADPFDGLFDDFFGPFGFQAPEYREKGTEKREVGGGTGFVIGENGLILTNRHVVTDENAEYTILTNDGEKYEAEVLFRDPLQDLAFLRAKQLKVKPLLLGDSDQLKIGQTVITIGNALGEFRNTVSVGVVSGLRRTITASSGFGTSVETLDEVIQTDAAINQGNSGGPLINLRGEVIGVNTAMAMGAENIGFAIPINAAKKNAELIKRDGKIIYPYLGVRYIMVNKLIQESNKLSVDYGALIVRGEQMKDLAIIPGSPADKANLRENDIILEVNGKKIDENYTLSKAILSHQVGDKIILTVLSRGETKKVAVTLEEMPS